MQMQRRGREEEGEGEAPQHLDLVTAELGKVLKVMARLPWEVRLG